MNGQDHMMHKTKECHLRCIQVSGVLHCARVIPIVSILDHRVKELSKHLMGKKKHFRTENATTHNLQEGASLTLKQQQKM